MKKTLAILNLLASIPLIGSALGLANLLVVSEPPDVPSELGVIGGVEGPTVIFLSSNPEPFSILVMALYAGLLILNGVVFWKRPGTMAHQGDLS